MHRSATSLLAKALSSEINMGKDIQIEPNKTHLYGYYENTDFQKLDHDILKAASIYEGKEPSIRNIPSEESILLQKDHFRDRVKETIKKNEDTLWGWKHPFTTLTIEHYMPYLQNPHIVSIFREPKECANNFVKRSKIWGDPISEEDALKLVCEYNGRLLRFITKFVSVPGVNIRSEICHL
jgi:hypothetical protein